MSRRLAALLITLACSAAIAALLWWRISSRGRPGAPALGSPITAATGATPGSETAASGRAPWAVQLYFPGADGRLYSEARELQATASPQDRLRAVVAAVLAGPQDAALAPALPRGVEVATAYLAPNGVAYVDLHAADRPVPPPAGSQAEMASVYSLVDSISLNLAPAQRVVLLWNGVQPESFSGHLDTSRPLRPDTTLLARPAGATASTPP